VFVVVGHLSASIGSFLSWSLTSCLSLSVMSLSLSVMSLSVCPVGGTSAPGLGLSSVGRSLNLD